MNLNCVICAELFSQSDEVYVTTCGHMFHYPCLRQWLERSKTCPQCRQKCYDKNVHRIYFNIANLDTSRVDVGTLQEKLENVELKNKMSEKELEKAREEIQELKSIQKKTMKTISALEKKVEQKNFLILSFNEQMNILKCENKLVDQLRKENKDLKSQIELMGSVEAVLTSTTSDVEKMLQEDNNNKTLCVWVVALKRELRISESKKTDMRNALKVVQHDLRKEREAKSKLEERIVLLESENYSLSDQVKRFEQQKENPKTARSVEDLSQICPLQQTKKIRLLDSTNTPSPSLSEKVRRIEESDSPYLSIKQSCVGLAPLLKLGNKHKKTELNEDGACMLSKSSSDLSDKYSIFKKPRLQVQSNTATSSNLVFNGMGGSDSGEDFSFSSLRLDKADKSKSISSRLKNGKLKKMPSVSGARIDKYLEKD